RFAGRPLCAGPGGLEVAPESRRLPARASRRRRRLSKTRESKTREMGPGRTVAPRDLFLPSQISGASFPRLPLFDHRQQALFLFELRPDRFASFECDFVQPFALTLRLATEMRRRADPQHAVERHVLVVDSAEDAHRSSPVADG